MTENVKAKLATIEANQVHLSKQMDGVSDILKELSQLLERFVRLEESQKSSRERLNYHESRMDNMDDRMDSIEDVVDKHEGELNKWGVYRRQFAWASGIVSSIIGGLVLWKLK